MNKRKIILYSSLGVIGLTITYVIFRRRTNKKLMLKIHELLDERVNATGNIEDFSDVFKGDQYISKIDAKFKSTNHDFLKLKSEYVQKYAEELNKAMVGWGTDEDSIYNTFRNFRDKVAIAQVSEYYGKKYNKSLYDHLKEEMTNSELKKLTNIIQEKYNYRLYK